MADLGSTFSNHLNEIKATVAVFAVTLAAVKLITSLNKKQYNLPPGPRNVPLLGYLPFLGKAPALTFGSLRDIYGDVFSINMGSFPTIVLNGMDAIREALVTRGDDFSARPAFTSAKLLNEGRNFGFAAFGPIWKAHRKVVRHVMYAFTNARNNPIEDIVVTEVDTIVDEFVAHGNKPFYPRVTITLAASSMIYQLCYGRHRNIREDPDFENTLINAQEFGKFNGPGNLVNVMPWLRHIMPWRVSKFLEIIDSGIKRRTKKVEEHEKTFDENHLRDITDGLLHAANHLSKEEKAVGLDSTRVIESLDTIFGAGGGTVSSFLDWSVLLMAAFPEVQEKVFKEIENVVGLTRYPSLTDRSSLPMVEAVIYEVFRFGSLVPLALPHATICDTTVQGYDVPEGTVVLINLYSVLHDKETWVDPEKFRPERFLLDNGQLDKVKAEQVIVFSLGRRRCVGEFLARMEVFLAFTTLIQRCRLYKPPGAPDYTLGKVFRLACEPEVYEVCAARRE
ncbi:cytochrome P450 1A1-like [Pomacea canaliculata]|uniref:cytochrome P450 1A1-like n=1 Tax=Pomacea canaliculata TaxID=400727 RepID=UPI000D72E889|nr:cytochrome P450 1A1-like [Pomacea canaliculata]XP_025087478.1 cytochrome P450 1A1-like [Pomacea canaliculata]